MSEFCRGLERTKAFIGKVRFYLQNFLLKKRLLKRMNFISRSFTEEHSNIAFHKLVINCARKG